jgi:MFS family permease
MLIFSGTYIIYANTTSSFYIWFVFAIYGLYSAFTDGVGRAIVADLVEDRWRATAYGIYSAFTGIALLPGSLAFGLLWDKYGAPASFYFGSILGIVSLVIFVFLRFNYRHIKS